MSGKGSGARPYSVTPDQFAANFDAIFGKKKPELRTASEIIAWRKEKDALTEIQFDKLRVEAMQSIVNHLLKEAQQEVGEIDCEDGGCDHCGGYVAKGSKILVGDGIYCSRQCLEAECHRQSALRSTE